MPLPLRCRCYALLHARALQSLSRRAEPSPPSLPPCIGPRCLPFSAPHHCLPPVSHPGRASPLFLLLHRCQATSRAFRPHVRVPEHPPTSEKLPEAWLTSSTTGAARHHRRTSVRSATASPSYSYGGAPSYHLATGHSRLVAPRWSAVPEPTSLACGPREQATRCMSQATKAAVGLGPCRFWPGGPEIQKIPFLFFIHFQTEFKLQKFVSKYLELQKL
jgi:hypothetical protein